jgi:hypothetical protein
VPFWNRLWGKDTVDLAKADIKSVSVDIRKERKTICPREPVQMAVFVEAILDGDKERKSVETWAGKGSVNKNDKRDFVEFAFHSDLGAFDKEGWFAPNASLLATADKEFEIQTVYKKQPDKFSFHHQVQARLPVHQGRRQERTARQSRIQRAFGARGQRRAVGLGLAGRRQRQPGRFRRTRR